ncbi:MAG: Electron transfer flavoprotein subunit beta/FixA family protein [Gammaproteobacteria bacterium]|nr:Electron transfer flavoprotein subunit beta/FixA family protein [Gammaproteobacteria bacterium]
MKIIVPVKRVIDANVRVRVKSDQTGVETANVKMAINPFCEIAVEQAVRCKEAGQAKEIVVVTVGPSLCQDILRTALAMGADRAILIETEPALQPLAIAKLLKALAEKEAPQMIIMGKQAIDDDNNQTGQMLSALLGWPQATFASRMELGADRVTVTREIDGGLETLSLQLPAVITVDLRLNEPRYVKLPNIMQAKKKPLAIMKPVDLGVTLPAGVKVLKVVEPPKRSAGVKVADVAELVQKLKHEAKVI